MGNKSSNDKVDDYVSFISAKGPVIIQNVDPQQLSLPINNNENGNDNNNTNTNVIIDNSKHRNSITEMNDSDGYSSSCSLSQSQSHSLSYPVLSLNQSASAEDPDFAEYVPRPLTLNSTVNQNNSQMNESTSSLKKQKHTMIPLYNSFQV